MVLQDIDKARYRKHLNIVIATCIISLLVISLGSSSLMIYFMGEQSGSNFVLNFVGVVLAAVSVGLVLYRIRTSPFMLEVVYVWRLKQELNVIYRHSAKLKQALEQNSHNALIVKLFNLKGSIQLYELDDNTLTLESLHGELLALETKLRALELDISTDEYHRDLLTQLHD